jgi:hypothetical protein
MAHEGEDFTEMDFSIRVPQVSDVDLWSQSYKAIIEYNGTYEHCYPTLPVGYALSLFGFQLIISEGHTTRKVSLCEALTILVRSLQGFLPKYARVWQEL